MSESGKTGSSQKESGKTVKEIIVESRTPGKGSVERIMEENKNEMLQELETSKIQRMLEEEKNRIAELQRTNQPVPHGEAQNFVEMMFKGRSAKEIKEILDEIGTDQVDKLSMMAAAMNAGSFQNLQTFMRQPGTSGKDIVDAVRTGAELSKQQSPGAGGSVTEIAKAMADMFKTGVELGRGQKNQPQESGTDKYLNMLIEELKLARQENQRERELKLEKEIDQIKNRPSAMDELASDAQKIAKYRILFGGVDQGTANEYTLKKEEMQQTERLENKKLDFEMDKWKYEKENSGKTIEQVKDLVKTVTEGPVGEVIKNFGSAGADRLRGGTAAKTPSNIVTVKCPNCGGTFPANGQLPTLTCPLCGVTLEAPNQPTPQQNQLSTEKQSLGTGRTVEQGQQPTGQ